MSMNKRSIITIEPNSGEPLENFSKRLIDISNSVGVDSEGTFNNVLLSVEKGSKTTIKQLVEYFHQESLRLIEAYQSSPEAIANAKENILKLEEIQKESNTHIEKLNQLEFSDVEKVLNWITIFQKFSDNREVQVDSSAIIQTFADNGYSLNYNSSVEPDITCKADSARSIIIQVLQMLKETGAIHHIVHFHIERWKSQFGSNIENSNENRSSECAVKNKNLLIRDRVMLLINKLFRKISQ